MTVRHRRLVGVSEDLVCASCSGRVGDGRCPTCRAALRRMRDERVVLPALPFLLAALTVLILLIALTR